MNYAWRLVNSIWCAANLILLVTAGSAWAEDSWTQLHEFYGSAKTTIIVEDPVPARAMTKLDSQEDPWLTMQSYYVFFSEEEGEAYRHQQNSREAVGFLNKQLVPYQSLITQASSLFDIPPEVIGAVIMVESSGNPQAKAKTSSAKGLMQTINSTFAEARSGLLKRGTFIADNPYQPRASILAGSWYLDKMFRQMERDLSRRFNRKDLNAWRKVAEYYYAGPSYGRKRAGVVVMYAGGRRVVVDKAGYAEKVIRWARAMG